MVERVTDPALGANDSGRAARLLSIIAGVWLFISAFVWTHTMAQRTNTWIMGIIIAAVAAMAMRAPQARFVNTIAAVWLFISAFVLPTISVGTVWNNIIVAIVVFAASMVGYAGGRRPLRPARV
jgi:hypothetical protein